MAVTTFIQCRQSDREATPIQFDPHEIASLEYSRRFDSDSQTLVTLKSGAKYYVRETQDQIQKARMAIMTGQTFANQAIVLASTL